MATRATYKFIGEFSGTHTAYIHHDGYPEFAYSYIEDAANIDAFMAKNKSAEITEDHEQHGDTDYHYTIQNGCVLCQKRFFKDDLSYTWEIEFMGTIEQFIAEYK